MPEHERTDREIDDAIRKGRRWGQILAELNVSQERLRPRWRWFREEVHKRVEAGKSSAKIVEELRLPPGRVAAFRAWIKRQRHDGDDEIQDAIEDVDALRDLSLNGVRNLNDLLTGKGIDPQQVLVMRHAPKPKPNRPEPKKVLLWQAAEKPDVFNAYQQTHRPRVEKAVLRARYVASFIGHEPHKALFIGLYRIEGSRPFPYAGSVPAYKELRTYISDDGGSSTRWFDLTLQEDFYAYLKLKLVVDWPYGGLPYWRSAQKSVLPVVAVLKEPLVPPDRPKPPIEDKDPFVEPEALDEMLALWRTKKIWCCRGRPASARRSSLGASPT